MSSRFRAVVFAIVISVQIGVLACTADPAIVEVTREVPVQQEIPVTVTVPQTVVVTREIPVTQQVRVTVASIRTVEVTREVETVKTVAVTREVPVTRIVQATPLPATPAATASPNPTPAPAPATPPTATPSPAPSATPSPVAGSAQFGSWRISPGPQRYVDRNIVNFQTAAVEWETAPAAPLLTYQCDNRNGRTMFIEWHLPLFDRDSYFARYVAASEFARYNSDPFRQYRDDDLDALADLAGKLLQFTTETNLSRSNKSDLDDIWGVIKQRWQLDHDSAVKLVNRLQERNHRSVLINLDFYLEKSDPAARGPHQPPVQAEIDSLWVVLPGHRTYISQSAIGNLKRSYRYVHPAGLPIASDESPVMLATVAGPEQLAPIIAKWQIYGLRNVMSYCEQLAQ